MSGFISGLNQATQVVNSVGAVAGSIGSLARDIDRLTGYLSGNAISGLGPWADELQPASWRGVPFAVRAAQIRRGRRIAVHEYPFRDDVWVEDLGRGTRVLSFTGFLVGDDVFAQRDAMLDAAETPGPGDLVHPSLGLTSASLTEFSAGERFDLGRVVELEFSFIEAGRDTPLFPSADDDTQENVVDAAFEMDGSAARDFGAGVANPVLTGVGAVQAGVRAVNGFTSMTVNLVNDGARVARAVSGVGALVGGDAYYGRYASSSRRPPPGVSVERTLSQVNRGAAAVAALTAASVNATQNVASLAVSAGTLAGAL